MQWARPRWAFVVACLFSSATATAQSFSVSTLDMAGVGGAVSAGTSLEFGPDGRLYVLQLGGTIDVFEVQRNGVDDYVAIAASEIPDVRSIPNHDDDATPNATVARQATGITVVGTPTNPVVYATSSDWRIGGPTGDKDLDTNSGVITRLTWQGSDVHDPQGFWEVVDLVRGLPRSEENHATNGLEFVRIGANDHLIVASGGHTNAGSPSTSFAWQTEYALSAAVLAIDLTQLESLPVLSDGGRSFVYDLPTVDDPTRPNANGIDDPNAPGYVGADVGDPWGGNDGLNQAKLVPGGPVQIFSPGYRNTYDLVVTESGAVYVTDNGANGGWGGYPVNEGLAGDTTNDYRPGEPGSNGPDPVHGDPGVNNQDHLSLVTTDVSGYAFGSFYAGHPTPVRANPAGAGLFTRGVHSSDPGDSNGNGYTDDWFRTLPFDPNGSAEASDPSRALPADWPPLPVGLANPIEGDFRNPGGVNPDGPVDAIVTILANNSNGIDEYTASNFGGAMQGDLIVGRNNNGRLHRVQLNPDGSLAALTTDWVSGLGGNALGVTANGDGDPFPGTIWVATLNANVVVLEPQDFLVCAAPTDPGYDPAADGDADGYTNQDEEDNGTDPCNGASLPGDFDRIAGPPLLSDLNDDDDDADGIPDAADPMQLGDPADAGSDAFDLPVTNELFSDHPLLKGYLGLGMTGLMNDGAPNPNWLDWLDETDAGPNPNDVLGGAVGAMTMQMTEGSAVGLPNTQHKGFQYGVNVDSGTIGFSVRSRLLNFHSGSQLYAFGGDGELGIAMGDGTQSHFVRLVAHADGVEMLQEIDDTPQAPLLAPIAVGERPTASLDLELRVDSANGRVEGLYAIDGGAAQSVGALFAQGAVLQAIQDPGQPLLVGLIGSSHTPGAEVEGTWDSLHVVGRVPAVTAPIADVSEPAGGVPSLDIDLDAHFDDDQGHANLVYTIEANSNPSFGATLSGSTLTLSFPASAATATITLRATDADGFFAEQSFVAEVVEATALYRVNAGGPEVAAIDGGIAWEQDTTAAPSAYLSNDGGNRQSGSPMNAYTPEVDTSTTPLSIFDSERYSVVTSGPMTYAFPVAQAGLYEVRLYMGNGYAGTSSPGRRVFSVTLEGVAYPDLTDLDLVVAYGHQVGAVVSHVIDVSDGLLEIDFFHGPANHPLVNGIEILGAGGGGSNPILVDPVADQRHVEGDGVSLAIGASGGDTPGSFAFGATGLPPGLQIDGATGAISGTLASGAAAGSPYPVSVDVDDLDADPDDVQTLQFGWTVDAAPAGAPVWIDLAEDTGYTARHECSFVQAGDRFYLFGGREQPTRLDTYDYASDSWSTSATAPLPFNHFQATEYQGLVWVVGAFDQNGFPNETSADSVYVFDPANDVWMQGPTIPMARRRGSTGLVQHGGRFYVVGGNTLGHDGGYVPWLDVYDPETGSWTPLADAPHARDHFHAAVVGDELFAVGGRLSGGPGGTFAPLVPEVDVYDLVAQSWTTLPAASDLPTPRAGVAVAVFDGEILVIGGEGNGQAYATVEALDPATGAWAARASLNHARHGTQAIVSGEGVYVAAGSPVQGGGAQKNMEVYDADLPSGSANTPGELRVQEVAMLSGASPASVAVWHASGSQGVFVESVSISGPDAADFALLPPAPAPFLVPLAGRRHLQVEYTGPNSEATASLDFTHSGGQTRSVLLLLPEPRADAALGIALLLLAGLRRRRGRG